MTNTKFRKRALLSSVAMLLVAFIALGSATFAWFVANPTATASGLKMQTKADAGIAIASKSILDLVNNDDNVAAYGSTTILRATGASVAAAVTDATSFSLIPASPHTTVASNAISFGTIAADVATSKDLDTEATWAAASGVYSEKVYLKTTTTDSADSAQVKSATVTITTTGSNAARLGVKVALVSSEGELIGIWKVDSGTDTKTWTGSTSAVGNAGLTESAYTYTASGTKKTLTTPITVGSTIDSNGYADDFITVYAYLDGENAGVMSSNVPAAVDLISGIDVTVSTVA